MGGGIPNIYPAMRNQPAGLRKRLSYHFASGGMFRTQFLIATAMMVFGHIGLTGDERVQALANRFPYSFACWYPIAWRARGGSSVYWFVPASPDYEEGWGHFGKALWYMFTPKMYWPEYQGGKHGGHH